MIKGFIFDLDGVITSTSKLHFKAWQKMAELLNIKLELTYEPKLRGISRNVCLEFTPLLIIDSQNL